jgi:hypothetical protein
MAKSDYTADDFDDTLSGAFTDTGDPATAYKIDGLSFAQYEKRAVEAWYNGFNQGSKANGITFLRKYRQLTNTTSVTMPNNGKFISEWLKLPIINQDINRLEDILKLVHPSISADNKFSTPHKAILDNMVNYAGGTNKVVEFDALVTNLELDKMIFTKTPISTQKPAIFSSPNNPFDDINMQHILDKHTLEHFQFTGDNMRTQVVDYFPKGTTQSQICDWIDQTLTLVKGEFGGVLPTKAQILANDGEWSKSFTLSVKLKPTDLTNTNVEFLIGLTTKSTYSGYTDKYIIGQFYINQPKIEQRDRKYLEILKAVHP